METARALNSVATTNCSDAGKWRSEYSDALLGKHVTVVAEADDGGRRHTQEVASFVDLDAASVKVIELP